MLNLRWHGSCWPLCLPRKDYTALRLCFWTAYQMPSFPCQWSCDTVNSHGEVVKLQSYSPVVGSRLVLRFVLNPQNMLCSLSVYPNPDVVGMLCVADIVKICCYGWFIFCAVQVYNWANFFFTADMATLWNIFQIHAMASMFSGPLLAYLIGV